MLVAKGLLGLWWIGRDAQHRGPAFSEGARQPGEVDGFPGAAWRVRARIEKHHQLFSKIVGQGDGVAAVTRQTEGRRLRPLDQTRFARYRRVGFPARRLARRRVSGLDLR